MNAFPCEIFYLMLDCLILETGCGILKANAFCRTEFFFILKRNRILACATTWICSLSIISCELLNKSLLIAEQVNHL